MDYAKEILNHTTPGQVTNAPELAEIINPSSPNRASEVSKISSHLKKMVKYGLFEAAGTDYTRYKRPIFLWRRL